jgi:hypothetical protein
MLLGPSDILPATGALGATWTARPWCWRGRQWDTAGTAGGRSPGPPCAAAAALLILLAVFCSLRWGELGHSTTCAALIYQYRTSLRGKIIADQICRRAEAKPPQSGTRRARDNNEPS